MTPKRTLYPSALWIFISVHLRTPSTAISPFEIVEQTPAEISTDICTVLRRSLQQSSDIALVVFLPVCVVHSLVDRDVILILHAITVLCDTERSREMWERLSYSSYTHDGLLVSLAKQVGKRLTGTVDEVKLTLPR